jgi:hypothetical protein
MYANAGHVKLMGCMIEPTNEDGKQKRAFCKDCKEYLWS